MQKKQNWLITNIEKETKNQIKVKAKQIGYTIPDYLKFIVLENPVEPITYDRQVSWLVHGLNKSDIAQIKDNAARDNKTIADYIKGLLMADKKNDKQKDIVSDIKKDIKIKIKELLSSI